MSGVPTEVLRRAVFLDRDGVLNELVTREGTAASPRALDDFRIAQGAPDALRRLRALGLLVFVVTNQPDVARGHLDQKELARMSDALDAALGVDEIAICPHDDADHCGCRKPKPGLLLALARRWRVDLRSSYVVGDSWRDVEAGREAGCRTILLAPGGGASAAPDLQVATLEDAVRVIESELDASNRSTGALRR